MLRQWLKLKVVAKQQEAIDIVSYKLADPNGRALPPFSAGAHIDVEVRDDLIRQYSLCNVPGEQYHYLIAVLKDPQSRGGSIAMHEHVAEGDWINVSEPKNHFPLAPNARKSLLFAGGIGVTPILCMAERLAQVGSDFAFHYCARSTERMAFVERIRQSAFAKDKVTLHLDDGDPAQKLDIEAALPPPQSQVHIYVCGPNGFMEWILAAARKSGWADNQIHREYFSLQPQANESTDEFEVQVASTGNSYRIPADQSIATVLRANGVYIPTSCEQGVCGTCLTQVLEGEPDHRDAYLTEEERARNDQMMPCCSRAKSKKLVLDL